VFNLNFGDLGAPCGLTVPTTKEEWLLPLLSVTAAGGMERAEWTKEDEGEESSTLCKYVYGTFSSFFLGSDISLALARVRINLTYWTTAIVGVALFFSLPRSAKLS